jgi:hypothetical protein
VTIRLRVDEAHGLVEVIFEGNISEQELADAIEKYMTEEYATLPLGLIDLTGVVSNEVPSGLVRTAAVRASQTVDDSLARGRLAIVASQNEMFGLARMYQILRDDSPVEVHVFRERGDAARWLGLPPADDGPS